MLREEKKSHIDQGLQPEHTGSSLKEVESTLGEGELRPEPTGSSLREVGEALPAQLSIPLDQKDEGWLYGPPPRITIDLINAVLQNEDEMLTLFIPQREVMLFIRKPEDYEIFKQRLKKQRDSVRRSVNQPGPLQTIAQSLENRSKWRELRSLERSSDTYQDLIIGGLCRIIKASRLKKLRSLAEARYQDNFLSDYDFQILSEETENLGLPSTSIDDILKNIEANKEKDGVSFKREEQLPLLHGASLQLRSLNEVLSAVNTDLEEVLRQLKDTLRTSSILYWIKPHSLTQRKAQEASRRCIELYSKLKTEEALEQGAWSILWNAGLSWIDLDWGRKKTTANWNFGKVSSLKQLLRAIQKHKIQALVYVVRAKLISRWFETVDEVTPALQQSAEDAERGFIDASNRETQKALWELAWACGDDRLFLDEGYATSLETLLKEIKARDIRPLITVVRAKLIHSWFRAIDANAALQEKARDAEQRFRSEQDSDTRLSLWQLAWACGDNRLLLENGVVYQDISGFCQAYPHDPALLKATREGLVLAWVMTCLRPDGLGLREALSELGDNPSEAHIIKRLQWHLGHTRFVWDKVDLDRPTLAGLIATLLSNPENFSHVGAATADGALGLWLGAVANDIAEEIRQEIRALALKRWDSKPLIAQRVFNLLGRREFILFLPGASEPLLIESVEDLIERAHLYWAELSQEETLARLHDWLTQSVNQPLNPASLFDLLVSADDTTMRQADGFPLGSECEGQPRFGGYQKGSAHAVLAAFVGWIEEQPAPPPEVEIAFVTGMLVRWAEAHIPELGEDLKKRIDIAGDLRTRYMACLWGLSYRKLMVNHQFSVERPQQLIEAASEHLPDIERLFDTRVLDAWAPSEARERLEHLHQLVDEANILFSKECPPAPNWLLTRCSFASQLMINPQAWLFIKDRAALAIEALGGRRSRYHPASKQQTISGMPSQTALNIGVQLTLAEEGDVPIHAVLIDSENCVCSIPTPMTGQPLVARLDQAEVFDKITVKKTFKILTVEHDANTLAQDVEMTVKINHFDRLGTAFKTSLLYIPILSILGGVFGYLLGFSHDYLGKEFFELGSLMATKGIFNKNCYFWSSYSTIIPLFLALIVTLVGIFAFKLTISKAKRAAPPELEEKINLQGNFSTKQIVIILTATITLAFLIPTVVAIFVGVISFLLLKAKQELFLRSKLTAAERSQNHIGVVITIAGLVITILSYPIIKWLSWSVWRTTGYFGDMAGLIPGSSAWSRLEYVLIGNVIVMIVFSGWFGLSLALLRAQYTRMAIITQVVGLLMIGSMIY
ncbi:hypothetical protein KJ940_17245 [Myxococcota bacterium]|nr:hypothetical protein [Myxococcota bacterium]